EGAGAGERPEQHQLVPELGAPKPGSTEELWSCEGWLCDDGSLEDGSIEPSFDEEPSPEAEESPNGSSDEEEELPDGSRPLELLPVDADDAPVGAGVIGAAAPPCEPEAVESMANVRATSDAIAATAVAIRVRSEVVMPRVVAGEYKTN